MTDRLELSQNSELPADVNADHRVSSADGLLLVNAINWVLVESEIPSTGDYLDVSGDGRLSAEDFEHFTRLANKDATMYGTKNATMQSTSCGADCLISDDEAGGSSDEGPGSDSGGSDSSPDDQSDDPADSGDVSGGDDTTGGGDVGSGSSGDTGNSPAPPTGGNSDGGSTPTNDNSDDPYDGYGNQCNHSLSGTTVREGQHFDLDLQVDSQCVVGFEVDWGDGIITAHEPSDTASYVYSDDHPVGTPADNFTVVVSLDYLDGTTSQLETTVRVQNVAPKAADDQYTTSEDTVLGIHDFALNDGDPSFLDTIAMVVSGLNTQGTIGEVSLSDSGAINYDPRGHFDCLAVGQTATDSFQYTIHDDDEPSVTSTASITITIEGRRELYLIHHGAGPVANEDGQTPATAFFTLSPPAKCGPVSINYHHVVHQGAAQVPLASPSDVEVANGTVVFAEGESQATATFTPVDDTIIEPDEWFHFGVQPRTTPDYQIETLKEESFFKIRDDEWRFVAAEGQDTRSIGPLVVEAFSTYYASSHLTGIYSHESHIEPNLGIATNSTATVRGDIAALLTRPGAINNESTDFMEIQFHCHSQTGDVWRSAARHGGTTNDGPLSAGLGMEYSINDVGNEEAYITVDLDFAFLAGGQISKTVSPGLDVRLGNKDKAQVGGFIRLEKQLTHSGGVQHNAGDGYVLRCQRGGGT